MLSQEDALRLVQENQDRVNVGRTIAQLIEAGAIPRLRGCTVQEGKVSDSVFGENLKTKDGVPIRLMYRTNRISTHDQARGLIPFKDQVLALNHAYMLNVVKPVLGTSQFDIPGLDPTSTVIPSENLRPVMLEAVVRAYNARSTTSTSLFMHYSGGAREFCGHPLPEGLTPNCRLPYPMDTPSTKGAAGQADRSVTPQELFDIAGVTPQQYSLIRNSALVSFGMVSHCLSLRGLTLVDTKTEHGINTRGEIVSMDELYTMDSSRFWKIGEDGNLLCDSSGEPVSFSKEFARGMVRATDGTFSAEQSATIAVRYIMGIQLLTGEPFRPNLQPREERIISATEKILDHLL